MCDYSLAGLPNRLGVEGEELVVHRFSTGSIGLAPAADLSRAEPAAPRARCGFWRGVKSFFQLSWDSRCVTAVCVPPGALLLWRDSAGDLPRKWGVTDPTAELAVRFVQTSADVNRYRDAIELPNGRRILLQEVPEGMRLQLLSFGGDCEVPEESTPLGVLAP